MSSLTESMVTCLLTSDASHVKHLKNIFTDSFENEVWKFIKKSDIVTYYYSDYRTVQELLLFLKNVKKAYDMALPLTLSNRYS